MTIQLLTVLFLGLTFGSFVTCASYRLPLGEDIVKKPSFCPKCNAKLQFLDLWPLLSWLASRGKCRHCHAPVSVRYPLTELVTAGVFVLIYEQYGVTLQALVLALLAVALLVMIVADLEHYVIPDQVHYVLLPLGLFWHYINDTPWKYVMEGAILGGMIGLALHYGYRHIRKKEGLGFGDVKFLAVAGLWLTPMPVVPFLFFSGVLGVATGLLWRLLGKGSIFPFGPSLALALFICVAYPEIPNSFWDIGNIINSTL